MSANEKKRTWIREAVRQYQGRLLRYAAQICGDLERGRDIVQETFLKLCQQNPDEIDAYLAQWLFTACRNQAIDVQRKEKRMKPMTLNQAADQTSDVPPLDERAEDAETNAEVARLMLGLSDNQREVVRLKFHGGLSYREIGAVLDLSVSNVGYLIHTALQKLRQQLNVDYS